MSSKSSKHTSKSSKKSTSKKHISHRHSSESSSAEKTKKVVNIAEVALKVDCPRCESKRGHRCVYTLNSTVKGKVHKAGDKRSRPHRVRYTAAVKKYKKAA